MTSALHISSSGLSAQRLRLDVIATNLAHADTLQTQRGGPYRRQMVVFTPRSDPDASELSDGLQGVEVAEIREDPSDFRMVHDPHHPFADPNGYVAYPNVNVLAEMVDLMAATRAYEANVVAINAAKSMAARALDILR
jgi:flagellar basal-body rod protein FlgC